MCFSHSIFISALICKTSHHQGYASSSRRSTKWFASWRTGDRVPPGCHGRAEGRSLLCVPTHFWSCVLMSFQFLVVCWLCVAITFFRWNNMLVKTYQSISLCISFALTQRVHILELLALLSNSAEGFRFRPRKTENMPSRWNAENAEKPKWKRDLEQIGQRS